MRFPCRLEAEAVAAYVAWRAAPSTLDTGKATLERARERAAEATFVQLENQIRLVLGQVAGKGGRDAFRTLARDADARGFKLIARKAREAVK